MRKNLGTSLVIWAVVCCWLLAVAGSSTALAAKTGAARKHHQAKVAITGTVVDHHGTAVAGARVHFAHHRKHRAHGSTTQPATPTVKKHKTSGTHAKTHHAGVLTKTDGTFQLHARRAGTHHLVAHKKGVGHGHAKVTVTGTQATTVVIKLHHKHHHGHSGTTGATGTTGTRTHTHSHAAAQTS